MASRILFTLLVASSSMCTAKVVAKSTKELPPECPNKFYRFILSANTDNTAGASAAGVKTTDSHGSSSIRYTLVADNFHQNDYKKFLIDPPGNFLTDKVRLKPSGPDSSSAVEVMVSARNQYGILCNSIIRISYRADSRSSVIANDAESHHRVHTKRSVYKFELQNCTVSDPSTFGVIMVKADITIFERQRATNATSNANKLTSIFLIDPNSGTITPVTEASRDTFGQNTGLLSFNIKTSRINSNSAARSFTDANVKLTFMCKKNNPKIVPPISTNANKTNSLTSKIEQSNKKCIDFADFPNSNDQICGTAPLFHRHIKNTRTARIVGGNEAGFGQFPWQASLGTISNTYPKNEKSNFFHACGATLIHPRWIVTAAHCANAFRLNRIRIKLGVNKFAQQSKNFPAEELRVVRRIVHERYNCQTFQNDIALLELERPAQICPHIRPICMAPLLNYTSTLGTITGWGSTLPLSRLPINELRQVQVPFLNKTVCEQEFQKSHDPQVIQPGFICAGYLSGGRDACQGDSGGPIQQYIDERWSLVGIISWGIGCGERSKPGVYTLIPLYLDWLAEKTRGEVRLTKNFQQRYGEPRVQASQFAFNQTCPTRRTSVRRITRPLTSR